MRSRLPVRSSLVLVFLLCAAVAPAWAQPGAAQKKVITHDVYDSWKSIQGTKISADGTWIAYALTPQEGDGELVVRNLKTNAEIRAPRGRDPLITLGQHVRRVRDRAVEERRRPGAQGQEEAGGHAEERRRHRQPRDRTGDDGRGARQELPRSG